MIKLDSKSKTKTKVLRIFEIDSKNRISIEKIVEGELNGKYTVKSQSKKLFFGYKNSTLAAWNIETDSNSDIISKIEYAVFNMLDQAVDFAKDVKKTRYQPNY